MVKPISLRLRNAEILAKARAALGRGREQELEQAHNARVMQRARGIVAQAREQDRQRRWALEFTPLQLNRNVLRTLLSPGTLRDGSLIPRIGMA
jgi:hypothetical protein